MNFYETKMGHIFFNSQIPQLINALKEIGSALSSLPRTAVLSLSAENADSDLLGSLYYGTYEPESFQGDEQEMTQTVRRAQAALDAVMPKGSQKALDNYQSAVAARNTAISEQAFRAGYRLAVQMLLAGITVPSPDGTKDLGNKNNADRDRIPYGRMGEIAAQAIDGLFSADPESAYEYCQGTIKMNMTEMDYFGIKANDKKEATP